MGTRIAALYDIHGNLPALDAVLADVDARHEIVVGGDVVLGPMPRETLDRLLELGPRARFLRGNCDRLVVDAFDGCLTTSLPPAIVDAIAWTAAQLDRRHRDALAEWPLTLSIDVEGVGEVLFCHATPRSDEEIFTADTPAEQVHEMLGGVAQPVVVCGHTHVPFDRAVGAVRVVNAGSVGMPFGEPGAHWLSLGPAVAPVRTDYDRAQAASLLTRTAYPGAGEFAARWVLGDQSDARR